MKEAERISQGSSQSKGGRNWKREWKKENTNTSPRCQRKDLGGSGLSYLELVSNELYRTLGSLFTEWF